jgi:hypothetical protein
MWRLTSTCIADVVIQVDMFYLDSEEPNDIDL